MNKWFSTQDLIQFQSLPNTPQGINKKARLESWEKRQVRGKQGITYEYAFSSLPQEAQIEILLKTKDPMNLSLSKTRWKRGTNYLPEVIWSSFEKASEKKRMEAQQKLIALHKIDDLICHRVKILDALAMVSNEFNMSKGSLKRWYYRVKKFERTDWLPLLLSQHGNNSQAKEAEFTPEAWEVFKADYFRNECPQFGSCYERLKRAAREQGWVIPSASSVKRKIQREIPKVQQVFLRLGEHALSQMYPSMTRTVEDIAVMEWINGDGYQHNVFVQWHNGEVVRPKTWIWQDIRTRKILAYRTDISENSDTIRLSLMDLVYRYGIPKHITLDNTRAAANKWMTGGVKNRYRFKVKDDEVMGIIPLLGIKLHWSSIQFGKGHGQAKPIERAFSHGGLGELVDKHPRLAGFYTGANPKDQPANYNKGKAGVSYAEFILALEDGIRTFNEREGRQTELCQGVYSFNQVFERDYQQASIRKASTEQLRLLMLMSEATSINQEGKFTLNAGGKVHGGKNEYQAMSLIGSHYKKVVVKFDPKDLHNQVWVYSLDGIFLAEAICTSAKAFGDKAAGREHDRARKQWVKAQKQAAMAQLKMDSQETSRYLPEPDFEDRPPQPSIIELFQPEGNVVRKREVFVEEEANEFEQSLYRGIALVKKERGL